MAREGELFCIEGTGIWKGYSGGKKRVYSFSLAESLPGKKMHLGFFFWPGGGGRALLLSRGMRAPLSGLQAI